MSLFGKMKNLFKAGATGTQSLRPGRKQLPGNIQVTRFSVRLFAKTSGPAESMRRNRARGMVGGKTALSHTISHG